MDLKPLATDRLHSSLNASQAGRRLSTGSIEVIQVVFSAKEPVWISVESDGKRVFRGTLAEREGKELKAAGRMIALVGNAGGLDITLNGKSIGSLGQHGQVRFLELAPSHGAYSLEWKTAGRVFLVLVRMPIEVCVVCS